MALRGRKIAIDVGSERTRTALQRKEVAVDVPTVLAHDETSNNHWAIGEDALEIAGRSPDDMTVIWPVRNGVIADYSAATRLLKHVVRETTGRLQLNRPDALVTISSSATSTERRALIDAVREAGAQEVFLIRSSMAAALGCGLPLQKPRGSMVIHLGAGTTEVGVFSLGGVVTERAYRVGGRHFNDAIIRFVRSKHGLILGTDEVRRIKHDFVDLTADSMKNITIHGQSLHQGMPQSSGIKHGELIPYIETVMDGLLLTIKRAFEQTPPDIISDIIKHGIMLTGGTANMRGLPEYLSRKLRVACVRAEEPELAPIKGAQSALNQIENYRRSLVQ